MRCIVLARRVVSVLLGICSFFLIGATFLTGTEKIFLKQFPGTVTTLLIVTAIALLFLFVLNMYQYFNRCSEKKVLLACIIMGLIMIILFALMMLYLCPLPNYDAAMVLEKAIDMGRLGEKPIAPDGLYSDYFAMYGNNYFFTLLLMFLYKLLKCFGVTSILIPAFLLNMMGVITAVFFTTLIGSRFGGARGSAKVLLLCVMNPVYYRMFFWIYTNIISVPFMMAIIYFAIIIYQTNSAGKRVILSAINALIVVMGFYIRVVTVIPVIAMVCCAILLFLKDRNNIRKILPGIIAFSIVFVLGCKFVSSLNQSYFSTVSGANLPISHWLKMASHGEGRFSGEDLSYSLTLPPEESEKKNLLIAMDNYKNMGVGELICFEFNKMKIVWAGADAQNQIRLLYDAKASDLYHWVAGNKQDFVLLYSYAFRTVLFILIFIEAVGLFASKKNDGLSIYLSITFMGAILFYCIWEVKESYSAPFILLMCLIGARGADNIGDIFIFKKMKRFRNRRILRIVFISGIVSLNLYTFYVLSNVKIKAPIYSRKAYCLETEMNAIRLPGNSSMETIEQTFTAEKPFNRIELFAEADADATNDNCIYNIMLYNLRNDLLCSKQISPSSIKNRKICIKTDLIIPDYEDEYKLVIEKEKGSEYKLHFYMDNRKYIDIYKGILSIDGVIYSNDLILQVYKYNKTGYFSILQATMYAFIISLIEIMIVMRFLMTLSAKTERKML